MNEDEFIKLRLEDQLQWYDKKSISCQKKYKTLRSLEIVCAALIPFISVLSSLMEDYYTIVIAGLGTLIVILAGINGMNKYHELWISYRTVTETLKHHQFLFETQSSPYNKKNAFQLLVKNIEGIISRENSNWNTLLNEDNEIMDETKS